MIIDCGSCVMRDIACDECVVTFLLGPPATLDSQEQTALAVLAEGGLVPPLRLVARDQREGSARSERPA